MSSQIAEISQRLQSALDQSYNVADMETVLHVISTLERMQITKEQLETTRLGKYINHLRRKTTNESLARRAKNLLRKWREMVLPGAASSSQQQQQQQQQPLSQQQQVNLVSSSSGSINLSTPHDSTSVVKDKTIIGSISSHGVIDRTSYSNDAIRFTSNDNKNPVNRNATTPNLNNSSNYVANTVNQTEDCQRYSMGRHGHDSNKQIGVVSNFNNRNKDANREMDQYRTLSIMNDNSRSPISISALPKIPKIKNSSSPLRISKTIDHSQSPLVDITDSSPLRISQRSTFGSNDDNSRQGHEYDSKLFPPNTSTLVNGRESGSNVNTSAIMDNSSNSSTIHLIDATEPIVTNVSQLNENLISETKKKHKKHKKDKKSKKQKQQSSPAYTDRSVASNNLIPELSDNLSNSSMGPFTGSINVPTEQKPSTSDQLFTELLASTIKPIVPKPLVNTIENSKQNVDLSFTGKFGGKHEDSSIINIDSSSSSNSPKSGLMHMNRTQNVMMMGLGASRSSSPSRIISVPLSRSIDVIGSRATTDDENSNQINLRNTMSSVANTYAESSSQDFPISNEVSNAHSIIAPAPISVIEPEKQAKKRGRKKGSKGVDSRLANATNSSQSQQGGGQHYDSISFTSLKNQIDLIRGTTKKVKTTKELLAELQNRKALQYTDDSNLIETPSEPASIYDGEIDTDMNGEVEELRSKTATPTSPKTSSNRSEKVKSSSKRRNSGGSIICKEPIPVDNIEPKNSIDIDIQNLRNQLPSIDKATVELKWQESLLEETIVCTCELIEVDDEDVVTDSAKTDIATKFDNSDENSAKNLLKQNVPKTLTENDTLRKISNQQQQPSALFGDSDPGTAIGSGGGDGGGVGGVSGSIEPPSLKEQPVKKQTVKSIFDLDYDEDDDPITFQINHNNNDTSLLINEYNISSKSSSIINNNNTKDNSSNNDISDDKNKQNCDEVKFAKEATTNTMFSDIPLGNMESTIKEKKNFNPPIMGSDQSDDNDDDNEFMAIPIVNATNSNCANENSIARTYADPINLNEQSDLNEMPPHKRFRIEEDSECKAMEYYVTSKQLITKFHVEKLHKTYIPNVNGNWDDALDTEAINVKSEQTIQLDENGLEKPNETIRTETKIEPISDIVEQTADDDDDECVENVGEIFDLKPRITEQSIGLYERVVPLCNHLKMDRLPKNLGDNKLDMQSDEVELHIFIANIMSKSENSAMKNESSAEIEQMSEESIASETSSVTKIVENELSWQNKQDSEVYACSIEKIECNAFVRYRRNLIDGSISTTNESIRENAEQQNEINVVSGEQFATMDVDDDDDHDHDDNDGDESSQKVDIEMENFDSTLCGSSVKADVEGYSSADGIDTEKVILPSVDDNQPADVNEELDSEIDSKSDDTDNLLPTNDENAVDFQHHLTESIEGNHMNQKKIESNGEYFENESEEPPLYESDSHDEADSGVRWYMQGDQDPSYIEERSYFVTLDNFSQGSDDDDDENSGDDDDNNCEDRTSEDGFSDRVNRMYENEYTDQLNRDQVNSEDTDDIVPVLVCSSELGQDKRSSGLDDDDDEEENSRSEHSSNAYSEDESSNDSVNMASSPENRFKYHFKSQNGKSKTGSRDEMHNRHNADSPSINSDSSSSSESSSYYRDRPCPAHYGRPRYRRTMKKDKKDKKNSPLPSLEQLKAMEYDFKFHVSGPAAHESSAMDIDSSQMMDTTDAAENRIMCEEMQSDLDDENSSPTESEAELVATFPPVVEIHQQPSQPIDNESDIHNENIPFECMLPEKLFQNEDSNDSCDKKNTSPNDGNVQLFNDSPSNEQAIEQDQKNQLSREQQPDNEEHEKEIQEDHESNPDETLPSENNERLLSFNNLGAENESGSTASGNRFREWYEVVHVKSYNDELLTILPYVVID